MEKEIAAAAEIAADLSRSLAVAKADPKKAAILDASPYVILRDGAGNERVEYLDGIQDIPHRKTGKVKLKDADSFNAYYEMHGNGAPVYATLQPAQFIAVCNDHTREAAGFRDHRIEFVVGHSKEWETWTKHNGSGAAFNSNESFALFLEDNSPDIISPDPSTMLNIALNFRLKADVGFSAAQRLQDGHIDFAYQNLVTATGPKDASGASVAIPEVFSIEVPVFDGIAALKYRVDARFRYRLREGKLTIWYELVRPHKVVEQAFKDIWAKIEEATKAPILHGTPE